jgi:Ser/Thr protein kinase RdoA (MazF antagonist)
MRTFEQLGVRGQLGRLRRLAESALAAYGVEPMSLTPLTHLENTTFRIEARDGNRYVLRLHRTIGSAFHPTRSVAEVRSEAIWLSMIRRETDLHVPEPVATTDGSLVAVVEDEGVPGPRTCVLFRWMDGRFLEAGLTPRHLERVGELTARLHEYVCVFQPPMDFTRWRIGDFAGDAGDYVTAVTGQQFGSDGVAVVESVVTDVERARRELGEGPEVFGLIHADLHQENYLFHHGHVGAIDFDDCGWGHFAHDLAVTLSELRWKADYEPLRAGLLRGYRAVRPFPADHERYLEILRGLRLLQLMLWFLEQRDHPGFPDWEAEAHYHLALLRNHLRARESA